MKSFAQLPNRLRRTAFLNGYGRTPRRRSSQTATLPGVDPEERRIRRAVWMRNQGQRQDDHLLRGKLGFAAALLVLALMLGTALTTSTSALERAATAQHDAPVEVVEYDAPAAPGLANV